MENLCVTLPLPRAKKAGFRYTILIAPHDANHRARIDADGNIILPGAENVHKDDAMFRAVDPRASLMEMEEGMWHSLDLEKRLTQPWTEVSDEVVEVESPFALEEDIVVQPLRTPEEEYIRTTFHDPIAAMLTGEGDGSAVEPSPETSTLWNDVREQMYAVTNDVLTEGTRQYQTSLKNGIVTGRSVLQGCKDGTVRLWHFLTQPVWVPGRNNTPKQYGRGTLFLLDTVRFGGTFASLFVVLFVSLNFQSFWSIAHSYVDPLADITSGGVLNGALSEKLKHIPSLSVAGSDTGDLTAFLPEVGPPENRLIIPKLNLNVPIAVPPSGNLLKEDWENLEKDIQTALEDGVVHYPGTARPGQAGNFFVTGHSSYFPWAPGNYKSVFARLGELEVGDEYWVYYGGDKFRYVIREKKEIRPSDVSVLDQPVSRRASTLMTCTPVGTTLRRLILSAQEVDPATGKAMEVGEHRKETDKPLTKMGVLPI